MRKFLALSLFIAVLFTCIAGFAQSAESPLYSCELPVEKEATVTLNCEELELRLGLEPNSLAGIRLTNLPSPSEGGLFLDGVRLEALDYLTRDEINQTVFYCTEQANSPALSFIADLPQKREARVVFAPHEESLSAPVLQPQSFATYTELPLQATFSVPSLVIASAPKKGTLAVQGNQLTYTPYPNTTGKDSFSLCAVSEEGTYSPAVAFTVTVQENPNGFVFADLTGRSSAYAALKLYEQGIVTGEQLGTVHLFYPDDPITQGELLLMVLASRPEITLAPCVNTHLKNDLDIPTWYKPYVKAAIEQGLLTEDTFAWDEQSTRVQSVVMVSSFLEQSAEEQTVLSQSDVDAIPAWAADSYARLAQTGWLHTLWPDTLSPNAPLTREDAALLVYALQSQEQQSPLH